MPASRESAIVLCRELEAGSWNLILAAAIDKGLERASQLGRQVFFADGTEQGDGRLIGLELRDAARAGRQVPLEVGVDLLGQMMLHEVRQKAHEVGAAAFTHVIEKLKAEAFELQPSNF